MKKIIILLVLAVGVLLLVLDEPSYLVEEVFFRHDDKRAHWFLRIRNGVSNRLFCNYENSF
jgi:hypothetical protein